ncbi:MAG: hypothetical protein HQ525_01575, partial [Anaerolineae bacterium]|nr:hypothetical protein [Anaerolineae bacterium]
MTNNYENLYQDAKVFLAGKDYDRASELLQQILVADHDYKDAAQLLAKAVKLKRMRWYNDSRVWGTVGVLVVIGMLLWLVPKITIPATIPENPTSSPTFAMIPTKTPRPANTATPIATPVPLVWKRISLGKDFQKDTVSAILVDPSDSDVIYVGMRNAGVYKSINGGLSWKPMLQGMENSQIRSMVIDHQNPNILYAGTMDSIYKTLDGAETWQTIRWRGELSMDPEDSSHIYALAYGDINETKDGGITWELKKPQERCPSNIEDGENGILLESSTVLWVAQRENSGGCRGGVYRSEDAGSTWTYMGLGDVPNISAQALGKDRQGNTVIYVIHEDSYVNDHIYMSSDGGQNWKTDIPKCNSIVVDPNALSTAYCVQRDGVITIIKDGQHTWIPIPGLDQKELQRISIDEYNGNTRLIVGGAGLMISPDNGKSWVES